MYLVSRSRSSCDAKLYAKRRTGNGNVGSREGKGSGHIHTQSTSSAGNDDKLIGKVDGERHLGMRQSCGGEIAHRVISSETTTKASALIRVGP